MQAWELFDHGADDAIARAAEAGDEGHLAGHAHVTGQGFQEVLDLGGTAVGLHVGQQGRAHIALADLEMLDEGIGGVVLARVGIQP